MSNPYPDSMINERTCERCQNFRESPSAMESTNSNLIPYDGYCHAYPPIPILDAKGDVIHPIPKVTKDFYCDDWIERTMPNPVYGGEKC